MSFKVSDILTPLYQEASQQFATLLIWDEWMYSAIDMALCDIYSYEWTNWGFMNKEEEVTFDNSSDATQTFTLEYPIARVNGNFKIEWTEFSPITFSAVTSHFAMKAWSVNCWTKTPISFKPLEKTITLTRDAWTTQWISYYGWYTKPISLDDIVPIPDAFKSAFRDLALHYIIWPQWQYGEQKSWDLFNRWQEKLRQLAKSGLWQISWISFK